MAPNGPIEPLWRCLLIGVDRKWLAEGQTGAFDPFQNVRSKGRSRRRGSQGRVVDTGERGDTPGSFG
jgi:hypothetical protein